jgi:hypothetical protein
MFYVPQLGNVLENTIKGRGIFAQQQYLMHVYYFGTVIKFCLYNVFPFTKYHFFNNFIKKHSKPTTLLQMFKALDH